MSKSNGEPPRLSWWFAGVILSGLLTAISCSHRTPGQEPVAASISNTTLPAGTVLEVSLRQETEYRNPFLDVAVEAEFTSPGGRRWRLKGFYYGNRTWKVRFRPEEPGAWSYSYSLAAEKGARHAGKGRFECLPAATEGPIRRHPTNPYRWVFANGSAYFPIGIQDCLYLEGGQLAKLTVDGEKRGDGKARNLTVDEYFALYGGAGFNLFRFSQRNCSYPIYDTLEWYLENESRLTDQLLESARRHGFRVMFGIFGYHGAWVEGTRGRRALHWLRSKLGLWDEGLEAPLDSRPVALEKRFIDYAVARWGVYADFWELLNERRAPDAWTTEMARYLHATDPDRKPVATSWERPALADIEINAPHWYESEKEADSDRRVADLARQWKAPGKPVIVGEQGNTGMNWDPGSARRLRIRAWTALFEEIALVPWNTSWSKFGMYGGHYTPGGVANIYLGPEERDYIRHLQRFAARLTPDVRRIPIEISPDAKVRAYGLTADRTVAAYLHHFGPAGTHVSGVRVTTIVPQGAPGARASWIDPASGRVIAQAPVGLGRQIIEAPAFSTDLALLVKAADRAPQRRQSR